MENKQKDSTILIKEIAVGNGVTDDTLAIQAIEDKYRVGTVHLLNSLHDADLIKSMLKDILTLLSHITLLESQKEELERKVVDLVASVHRREGSWEKAEEKIKELELQVNHWRSHYDAVLINWNLSIERVEELEESRDFWKKDSRLEQAHSVQCEKRITQLESELKEQKALIPWIGDLARARVRVKELVEGIGEVLDGTLPYLAEQRLKKLVEKG